MLLVSHFSLQLDILRAASFRSTDCSDTTRQQTLQGTTRPTTAGCRSSDVSMPLGERFQVGFMLWTPKCGKKTWIKKVFSETWECSEECGNISKNKRIDHANLRDFCVWPRDATLSGISFPITLQIAPVIVPLIMFSFDPRSPCPSPSHPSDIEVVSPRTWHLSWRSTKVHWHSPSSPPRAPTSPSGSMRRLGLEKLCLNKRKIWKIWKQARFL